MKYRPYLLLLLILPLLSACAGDKEEQEITQGDIERAQMALQPFKEDLLSALGSALEKDPASAIQVCQSKASQIAARRGRGGVKMGRTSHRLRNRNNAPAPWMKPLLDAYAQGSEDRPYRTVRVDDDMIGYVEPIITKPVCLTCHGANISEPIAAQLYALYPNDKATGFESEEFRGLFWVTLKMGDNSD